MIKASVSPPTFKDQIKSRRSRIGIVHIASSGCISGRMQEKDFSPPVSYKWNWRKRTTPNTTSSSNIRLNRFPERSISEADDMVSSWKWCNFRFTDSFRFSMAFPLLVLSPWSRSSWLVAHMSIRLSQNSSVPLSDAMTADLVLTFQIISGRRQSAAWSGR